MLIVAGDLQHLLRQLRDRRRHRRAEEQRLPLRRRRMCFSTRRMSGRKPMSSIRSASSSTRILAGCRASRTARGSDRAAGPACATMTSTPLRKACSCGPMPTPPKTAARGQRRVHREVVEVLDDLRRQLARRRQDQRARRAARLADQPVAGSAAGTPRSCRCRSSRRRAGPGRPWPAGSRRPESVSVAKIRGLSAPGAGWDGVRVR